MWRRAGCAELRGALLDDVTYGSYSEEVSLQEDGAEIRSFVSWEALRAEGYRDDKEATDCQAHAMVGSSSKCSLGDTQVIVLDENWRWLGIDALAAASVGIKYTTGSLLMAVGHAKRTSMRPVKPL